MIGPSEIQRRFAAHEVCGDVVRDMQAVRSAAGDLAALVDQACPDGREKSLAWTKLEEVVFWANAALARGPNA